MTYSSRRISLPARIASILIILSMICTALPAFAVTYVAKVDSTLFTDYLDAWNFVKKKGTIDMLTDWNIRGFLSVAADQDITINMHGHMINRNNTNADDIYIASDTLGSGTAFNLEDDSKLTLVGISSDWEKEYYAHKGKLIQGVWYSDSEGTVEIQGGLITGCGTNGIYSAITIDEGAELVMENVTLAGNVSDTWLNQNGFGGAITVDGIDSVIKATNCTISYNYAASNGGAIACDYACDGSFTFKNCTISDNIAGIRGGAIYVGETCEDLSINLSGSTIQGNKAKEGGAIFILETDVTINGGSVTSNSASECGGGVYILEEDNTLRNMTIAGNRAAKAGGVYVSNDNLIYTPIVTLGGKMIIKSNTASNVSTYSNLVLEDDGLNPAKIAYDLSTGSEVHILCQNRVITDETGTYDETFFYADGNGQTIYWGQDKDNEDEFRQLVMGTGTREADPALVTLNPGNQTMGTALTETKYIFTPVEPASSAVKGDYTVYKGYSRDDDSGRELYPFYYTDGYFFQNPTYYNEHLATTSMNLEMSAFNSNTGKDSLGNSLKNTARFTRVKQFLADIGCDDEKTYISPTYLKTPEADTIAFAIGQKQLKNASGKDSGYILIPIAVRGAGYDMEWASNVTLGYAGEHKGFSDSATQVMDALDEYIEKYNLQSALDSGKVRFWVVGFSRAGAVANLTSKRLIDRYQEKDNAVYCYTFEAPQGGVSSEMDAKRNYNSIHNIISSNDLVPYVAMSAMDFQRYGVDHFVPGSEANKVLMTTKLRYAGLLNGGKNSRVDGSDSTIVSWRDNAFWQIGTEKYEAQKKIMKAQLKALPSHVMYDDYFHLATFSVVSAIGGDGIFSEVGSDDVVPADWLADFTTYLSYWIAGRNARSTYVSEGYQETARVVLAMLNGMPHDTNKAKERLFTKDTIANLIAVILNPTSTVWDLYVVLHDAGVFADDALPLSFSNVSALLEIVLSLAWNDLADVEDYDFGTSVDYDADGENLVQLGTLLYNSTNLLKNHNFTVVDAWLRSFDSYYLNDASVNENRYAVRAATTSEVDMPYLTYTVNGQEYTLQAGQSADLDITKISSVTNVQLHMTERNAGGAIYYSVQYGGYTEGESTFYQEPFDLSASGMSYTSVLIKAHTLWQDTPSAEATFCIIFDDTFWHVYVATDGPMNVYGAFKSGDQVNITVPANYGTAQFANWSIGVMQDYHVYYSIKMDWNNISFPMPDQDVYLTAVYSYPQVEKPQCGYPYGTTFDDVETINFYTASGTVDDDFHVHYTVRKVYEDHSVPDETYSVTDEALYLTGSENCVVRYYIDDLYATKDGWVDSEHTTQEFIVDYSLQVYTVTVEGGTIDGTDNKNTAQFHPGETVTIIADEAPGGKHFEKWQQEGASVTFEDETSNTTTFTMPYMNVTVQTVLQDNTKYTIEVINGKAKNAKGEVIFCASVGETITLVPDPAAEGFEFTRWDIRRNETAALLLLTALLAPQRALAQDNTLTQTMNADGSMNLVMPDYKVIAVGVYTALVPSTGDASPVEMWSLMSLVGLTAFIFLIRRKRKA